MLDLRVTFLMITQGQKAADMVTRKPAQPEELPAERAETGQVLITSQSQNVPQARLPDARLVAAKVYELMQHELKDRGARSGGKRNSR